MPRGRLRALFRMRPPTKGLRARAAATLTVLALASPQGAAASTGALAPAAASSKTAEPSTQVFVPGVRDTQAGLPGRWRRELQRREDILKNERGRSPRAVVALLGLLPALEGEIPTEELMTLVRAVADDRSRDPLVRSFAAYQHARLLEGAGQLDEAREAYAADGFLTRWRIVGPFDNANHAAHHTPYEPEQVAYEPTQSFLGKLPNEPLQWREVNAEHLLRGGLVSFDEFVRPNVHVTGYATTWVRSDRKRKATLHLGSGGAYSIWVGGTQIAEDTEYVSPHPLQRAHAIELRKGWNRILVETSVENGVWGFVMRLSDPSGAPIRGLEVSNDPQLPSRAKLSDEEVAARLQWAPPSLEAGRESGKPPRSLRGLLEEAADAKKPKPRDLLALAELYQWIRPFPVDSDEAAIAAIAADDALASARSAWLVALLDPDEKAARQALEKGIERARAEKDSGLLAQMLLDLAWRNRSLGMETRARELIEEAQVAAPDDAVVELARMDILATDGFGLTALAWLEELRKRYPESATIAKSEASRLLGMGRTREALARLEAITKVHHGDIGTVAQRIEGHLALGEVDEAVKLAERVVDSSPALPAAHLELARLREARGDLAGALAATEEALELAPHDPDLHVQIGRLRSRAGEDEAAILAFKRSLELNPQQPELRDLLHTIDARGDDLFADRGLDLKEVVAANEDLPDSWKGKEAGILHHRIVQRISRDGLGERLDHRIIRVLDERGVRSQAIQALTYDPAESYVDVRRARVRRADGTVEDVGNTQVVSLAAAGYRMYYDQRQVRVFFPGLRVGDTVEVAFVKRDVVARNKFDEYYGDIVPLSGAEPRKHVEYVLEAPAKSKLHFNRKVERKLSEDGKVAIHRVQVDDVAGIRPEADMPGWTEVADYLHVSTYATWDDVGKWYWGLVEEQLVVDDQIRAGVKSALEGLEEDASEAQKVAQIYRHVIRSTRYVGLEFGIHGYKPYRTSDVYDRRFGDCKDKASLLKVMLKEAGIDSHLVLVRTRDQGRLAKAPASLSAFNHAIVYVPSLDLWLDGTAEWSGANELPLGDQGASVLVIEDGKGATFRTIPYSTPDANVTRTVERVSLRKDGSARVRHEMTMEGAGASSWRSGLQSPDQRDERLTKILGVDWPGLAVKSAKFPGIGDVLAPVKVDAELDIPAWAQSEGEGLRFRAIGREGGLARRLAPQTKRVHPLELRVPSRQVTRVEYELPEGHELRQVPESRRFDSAHGSFALDVSVEGRKASVEASVEVRATRIEPAEYPAFREFLRKIDASLEQAFEAAPAR